MFLGTDWSDISGPISLTNFPLKCALFPLCVICVCGFTNVELCPLQLPLQLTIQYNTHNMLQCQITAAKHNNDNIKFSFPQYMKYGTL